jgi:DNA-binding NarL/FixJ family response regulator
MDQPKTSPSRPTVTEILIVDDHPAIHLALQRVISGENDMVVVETARTREAALEFINQSPPSIAIVDISLDESYGLRLVREISEHPADISIVVFSMFDDHVYGPRAISAGAQAYVMKRRSPSEIISAIRDVRQGNIHLSDRLASSIVDALADDQKNPQHPFEHLTDREFAVFHLLGQGYSLKEISTQLDISLRTVRTSRRKVRKKMNLGSTGHLLELATEWFHHHATQSKGSTKLTVAK